jgi:hypothetical protein
VEKLTTIWNSRLFTTPWKNSKQFESHA